MLTASEVAVIILQKTHKNGYQITNMKLQKLLYYCQGYYIAIHGERLFSDRIEAWEHGPVVPKVYHEYKSYGKNNIPPEEAVEIPEELESFIDFIVRKTGNHTAHRLRAMSHEEAPYKNTTRGQEISTDLLNDFFTNLLWEDDEDLDDAPLFETPGEERKFFFDELTREELDAIHSAR